jgi:hypothetical protein
VLVRTDVAVGDGPCDDVVGWPAAALLVVPDVDWLAVAVPCPEVGLGVALGVALAGGLSVGVAVGLVSASAACAQGAIARTSAAPAPITPRRLRIVLW